MPLFKPNRRDLVIAAAEKARQSINADATKKSQESTKATNAANDLRHQAAEKVASLQLKKLEPLAELLNAVTEGAGYGSPFKVATTYDHPANQADKVVVVNIVCDSTALKIKTKAKYPKDSVAIKKLVQKSKDLNTQHQELSQIARELQDRDVISGSINANLNGESAIAMDVLAKNIKEVALDVTKFSKPHFVGSRRLGRR